MIALLLASLVTYLERAAFLISKRVRPPKRVMRYLPLVGPAVLGAIAVPGILAPAGVFSLVETAPAVVGSVLGALAWRFSKQVVVGLIVGLGVWWGLIFALVQLGLR